MLGNPSDGYEGKAIACPLRDFSARVSIAPDDALVISAGQEVRFRDLDAACEGEIASEAGGLSRLVLAALRRFVGSVGDGVRTWAVGEGRSRFRGRVRIACETTVPRQVGLAGSSAAVIATIRALASYLGVSVAPFELAEMALATEVEDLGIAAGPMDRVIQAYERPMALDLRPPRTESSYRVLDASLLPPLLIAWSVSPGRSSGHTHSDLRERWERGDADVVSTMQELRTVTDRGLRALERRDLGAFADLVDRNLELRRGVTAIGDSDRTMIELARAHGAAAKLCGSGGSVLVVPRDGEDPSRLGPVFAEAGFPTCRPTLT